METLLRPHLDTLSLLIESIEVHVERSAGGRLWLRYHVEAPLDDLVLGDPATSVRTDGLWKTTCFEMFVRMPGDAAYAEFNFSPSSRWAAYRFADYREQSINLDIPRAPEINLDASETHVALEVDLVLPLPWDMATIEIGLSAVIGETDGTQSYWALAHPPGNPDFHHSDCFALTLAALNGA